MRSRHCNRFCCLSGFSGQSIGCYFYLILLEIMKVTHNCLFSNGKKGNVRHILDFKNHSATPVFLSDWQPFKVLKRLNNRVSKPFQLGKYLYFPSCSGGPISLPHFLLDIWKPGGVLNMKRHRMLMGKCEFIPIRDLCGHCLSFIIPLKDAT